jgi:hypothetical protein
MKTVDGWVAVKPGLKDCLAESKILNPKNKTGLDGLRWL